MSIVCVIWAGATAAGCDSTLWAWVGILLVIGTFVTHEFHKHRHHHG